MSSAAQREASGARALAEFLLEHGHCDGDFEITHPSGVGAGLLLIRCGGCGEAIEHRPGDAESRAPAPLRDRTPPWPAPGGSDEPAPRPYEPRAAEPSQAPRPSPRRVGLVAALIAGLAALVFVPILLLLTGDDPDTGSNAGGRPAPGAGGSVGGAEAGAESQLEPIEVASQFEIGVPDGWETRAPRDGGTSLTPDGNRDLAEVRIVWEDVPSLPLDALAASASGLLAQDHPRGDITGPEISRLAGRPVAISSADYGGGVVEALVIRKGDAAFLITRRVDDSAPGALERDANAIVDSFRPL